MEHPDEQNKETLPSVEDALKKIKDAGAQRIKKQQDKIDSLNGVIKKPPVINIQQEQPIVEESDTIEPENVMEDVEISDDVNTALISVFKEVIRSPNAVPGKVIPFAQVLLKKKILDLKNADPKIIDITIGRFQNIWEVFKLSEIDDMLFLNDAINGEIEILSNIQREIEINEKALDVLSERNATIAVNQKKFGGGFL